MEKIESRRRINLKQTAKGLIYWDITVEVFNKDNRTTLDEVLELKEMVERAIPKVENDK